jgi:hypothetical protein
VVCPRGFITGERSKSTVQLLGLPRNRPSKRIESMGWKRVNPQYRRVHTVPPSTSHVVFPNSVVHHWGAKQALLQKRPPGESTNQTNEGKLRQSTVPQSTYSPWSPGTHRLVPNAGDHTRNNQHCATPRNPRNEHTIHHS